jgi:hypothetical protein
MAISGGVSRTDPLEQEKLSGTDRVVVAVGDADSTAEVRVTESGAQGIVVSDDNADTMADTLQQILLELRLTNELLKGILQ